ncbi:hypothetical protein [Azospirillum sp.]|uniref:hypothetical protein n=1 Tax=Azospirillum sp. TaxID=34012 RepID=UPI002D2C94FC|nr:hypothetical protein [Azospirillum sp.]HYD69295.1 hypothetical protein [Azospirillum sp.]
MNIRRISAIALTATVLTSGVSFAQSTSAGSFEAQLNEAKSISLLDVERDRRSTVANQLNVAENLYAQGNIAEAEPYLRLARGMLGLDNTAPNPATQVGERTGAGNAIN